MSAPDAVDSPARPEAGSGTARNAFHLVLGQVGTTALAIVLGAALGRYLGAADFGLFFLATSASGFAYVVAEWGQGPYVIREVARTPGRASELLGSAVALRLGGAAVMTGLTACSLWILGYDARTVAVTTLVMAATLPFFLAQACAMIFRGRQRMDYEAQATVLNKALTLALSLGALLLGGGLVGVVGAQGLAGVLALVASVALLRRLGGSATRAAGPTMRELLVGGTPIVAASLAVAAQGYIDALVLSKLAPAPVVGWYGAARTIIGTLIAPATILGAAAYPRLSQVSGQPVELRAEVRAALRPLLGMGALAAIGTWLFADLAIEVVYGRAKFGPAAEVLRVFAPGFFLLFVDILLGNVMLALGLARRGAAAKLLSVVASTGLDLLLIPVCQARLGNGGVGVVLAFAGSEVIMFAAALLILPRGTVGRGALGDVARAVSAGVATLLLFRLLPPFTPLAAVPLVVLVFGGLGVVLGLFRRSDLELLRAAMRRRAAR